MPAPLASEYALPAYAQTSPQDEITVTMDTLAATAQWQFVADGDFIYVPVTVFATATTSGAAGNRLLAIFFQTAIGNTIVTSPAAAVQGPGVAVSYSASPAYAIGQLFGNIGTLPLPVIPLSAGMALNVQLTASQAGDVFPAPSVTLLRYSTEPVDVPAPVRVPTPILL